MAFTATNYIHRLYFYVTNAGTIFDLLRYGIKLDIEQVNLLLFSQKIDVIAYLLNVLLFVPFGFLLPYIWPDTDNLKYCVISGFSFSLLIEISQLFNVRHTDVDDLLMNTFGALAGFLLFRLFSRITLRASQSQNHLKYEPVIYILAMFLGRFLLFNGFGLAKILYGF